MKTDIRHKSSSFYPAALAATVVLAAPVLADEAQPTSGATAPGISFKATGLETTATLRPVSTGASNGFNLRLAQNEATAPSVATSTVAGTTAATVTPQRDKGFYLSLGAGTQNRGMAIEKDRNARLTFDRGSVLSAAVGYRYRNFRVEGEYSRWQNDINNTILIAQGVNENGSGEVELRSLMLNVYYDFRLKNPRLVPYVGVGYGNYKSKIKRLSSQSLEMFEDLGFFPPGSFPFSATSTSDEPSAYQLKAGVGYHVSRRSIVSVGYRYFHGQRLKFNDTPFGVIEPSGSHNHVFEVGYRFNF